ncbi:hypothetical protein E1295_00555 [Nonomuraea mesophila]|uniref:Uncharacterized protein n=1 Tax=Nonomuraea mesophila TaxID=2530382 RepID=A0A4R5FZ76_9ACTN|nr:hypothetical protein [Nonomuraea mesophila]TDE60368.1 hypothetical protein E1295_00555 [Nonomuraea mesophila]
MPDKNDPREEPAPADGPAHRDDDRPPGGPGVEPGDGELSDVEPGDGDPRDNPAPFAAVVLLTAGVAVAVMVISALMSDPPGAKFVLGGPIATVIYGVVSHEVWWPRWWGAIPGAIAGLAGYFEGRAALADLVGDAWAHPVAYVAAWTLFAVVFALCSRFPRTFSRSPGSSPA